MGYREDKVAKVLRIEHACARISGVARMVKLVDTADLKSAASNGVPVRFRLRAPVIYAHFFTNRGLAFSFRSTGYKLRTKFVTSTTRRLLGVSAYKFYHKTRDELNSRWAGAC